eukprot:TRINITY_DN74197_c0_g1_i1.p1 TRINITY_DN74197_c0_g1~~TRINITY_DN74197_c0_g1_i1.p1  ORF type:complete len:506 (-),score=66.92 TRINITY_DN74197_c0_g1_i1:8-1474(-)
MVRISFAPVAASALLSSSLAVPVLVAAAADEASLQTAADAHDEVLNYTFTATEFDAPWSGAASVNGDTGISFQFVVAAGDGVSDYSGLKHVSLDPWAEHEKSAGRFDLSKSLREIFQGLAGGNSSMSDTVNQIAVVVHGFRDSGKGKLPRREGNVTHGSWPVIAAADLALLAPGKTIAIAVDWKKGASHLLQYSRAMSTTRVIGQYISRLLEAGREVYGEAVHTWCVGHSLGSHICGFAGKYLKQRKLASPSAISALDPAGPSVTFLRTATTSFVEPSFAMARLQPADAIHTEALYTDWGGLGLNTVLAGCIDAKHWYASWQFSDCHTAAVRLASVEVFVNPDNYTAAGGDYPAWLPDQSFTQAGCSLWQSMQGCSHDYAYQLFLLSLQRRLQGASGLSVSKTCSSIDVQETPIDLCRPNSSASAEHILMGPALSPTPAVHNSAGAFGLGPGLLSPAALSAMFPDAAPDKVQVQDLVQLRQQSVELLV